MSFPACTSGVAGTSSSTLAADASPLVPVLLASFAAGFTPLPGFDLDGALTTWVPGCLEEVVTFLAAFEVVFFASAAVLLAGRVGGDLLDAGRVVLVGGVEGVLLAEAGLELADGEWTVLGDDDVAEEVVLVVVLVVEVAGGFLALAAVVVALAARFSFCSCSCFFFSSSSCLLSAAACFLCCSLAFCASSLFFLSSSCCSFTLFALSIFSSSAAFEAEPVAPVGGFGLASFMPFAAVAVRLVATVAGTKQTRKTVRFST